MEKIEISCDLCELQSDCGAIEHISAEELSYNQFFSEFMSKNIPVVIKNTKILTAKISNRWINKNGAIDIDQLEETLNDITVPVYNCSKQYFNSHEKTSMSFSEYAKYWKSTKQEDSESIYLKDFHLAQNRPDLNFYEVPKYFASDWLNEFLIDNERDDYRFVYLGIKGTWTPLHADVFGSFSWSVNVSGRKRWIFMPPGEENKLRDKRNQMPISAEESELKERGIKYFVLEQEAGDAIFVPSQWYHQVNNLTDVLSVNHNWFNGCNISTIFANLVKNFEDVKREIADCSDMENFDEHCQVMLKSLFGLNFEDFREILMHTRTKRLDQIENGAVNVLFDTFELGENHARYDLQAIDKVLNEMQTLNLNNTPC